MRAGPADDVGDGGLGEAGRGEDLAGREQRVRGWRPRAADSGRHAPTSRVRTGALGDLADRGPLVRPSRATGCSRSTRPRRAAPLVDRDVHDLAEHHRAVAEVLGADQQALQRDRRLATRGGADRAAGSRASPPASNSLTSGGVVGAGRVDLLEQRLGADADDELAGRRHVAQRVLHPDGGERHHRRDHPATVKNGAARGCRRRPPSASTPRRWAGGQRCSATGRRRAERGGVEVEARHPPASQTRDVRDPQCGRVLSVYVPQVHTYRLAAAARAAERQRRHRPAVGRGRAAPDPRDAEGRRVVAGADLAAFAGRAGRRPERADGTSARNSFPGIVDPRPARRRRLAGRGAVGAAPPGVPADHGVRRRAAARARARRCRRRSRAPTSSWSCREARPARSMRCSCCPPARRDRQPEPLVVFAAVVLTDAFTELGREYERAHPGETVTFSFAGSQSLVAQVQQGAPADVVATADTASAQSVADRLDGRPRCLARNRLAIVTSPGDPLGSTRCPDLAGLLRSRWSWPARGCRRAGRRARADAARVRVQPDSEEPDMRAVVQRVRSGGRRRHRLRHRRGRRRRRGRRDPPAGREQRVPGRRRARLGPPGARASVPRPRAVRAGRAVFASDGSCRRDAGRRRGAPAGLVLPALLALGLLGCRWRPCWCAPRGPACPSCSAGERVREALLLSLECSLGALRCRSCSASRSPGAGPRPRPRRPAAARPGDRPPRPAAGRRRRGAAARVRTARRRRSPAPRGRHRPPVQPSAWCSPRRSSRCPSSSSPWRARCAGLDRRHEEAAARSAPAAGRSSHRDAAAVGPSLVAGAALGWARALGEFGATITFAGNLPGRTQTLPLSVYTLSSGDPRRRVLAVGAAAAASASGWSSLARGR